MYFRQDQEVIEVRAAKSNLASYEEAYKNFSWEEVEKDFSWYSTGKLNAAYEAVDRHVHSGKGDRIALYYSDTYRENEYTFRELMEQSNRFGNVLRSLGVKKGDRVFLLMPRIPEFYFAFLGIVKIGAIAGPLFEAFMGEAIRDRIKDSEAVAIVTTSNLKDRIPISDLPSLKHMIVVGEANGSVNEQISFEHKMSEASTDLQIEWMNREDGILLLYTSGSTGKPKGILHVHNGMIQHLQTAKWVLDLQEEDIYWCTADPGWITGISYGIWGPWLNGVTTVVRGGRFSPEDWYRTIEKYKVSVWFSAPTAFRMLMAAGTLASEPFDLGSLRHVLSAGEPLNAEVIRWGLRVYDQRIHDNWWMTESGGQLISNYPCMPIKPGSMGRPFPGVEATILDDKGNPVPPRTMGNLAIRSGWPSIMRAVWNNPSKYQEYFRFDPWYLSGDTAYRDEDGYFWFQGRVDDVINTAGERVGPFEVESKLIEHPAVAEAGVIGIPDAIRGEVIKAFVSLRDGFEPTQNLIDELKRFVRSGLAAHAAPRDIEFLDKMPKTRSGKIVRRILKAKELGLPIGDVSSIED
jgi:acetyl-CoA synthetase